MTTPPAAAPGYFRTSAGQWTIAAIFLAGFVVLAWLQRVPSLTTANDDATYVLLARSLRDGGFNSIHLVGAPIHTKYPPVFPVLLAAVSLALAVLAALLLAGLPLVASGDVDSMV